MSILLTVASSISGALSLAGHAQGIIGSILLARFCRNIQLPSLNASKEAPTLEASLPGVTVLKPLHGDEPLLEEALESLFLQNYPNYQIVFGLHSQDDPALTIVRRLQQHYPQRDVVVVVDASLHGPNRKVGNLINMHKACKHDIFIISDSDIHVSTDYIESVVSTLEKNNVQLVTTLYAGLPASKNIIRQFGAHSINANFLPGVMISRLMGRQDCLGATMALRTKDLKKIGGFEALVDHVADDATLGQLIRHNGGDIALAPTLCHTTVAEKHLKDLFSHELRWGRTVRSVEPLGYGLSSLQLPLFWGGICVLFAPYSPIAWSIFLAGWLCRYVTTYYIGRLTNCSLPRFFPFLPLRDWMSACVMFGSASGSRVAWRGQTMHITRGKNLSKSL